MIIQGQLKSEIKQDFSRYLSETRKGNCKVYFIVKEKLNESRREYDID